MTALSESPLRIGIISRLWHQFVTLAAVTGDAPEAELFAYKELTPSPKGEIIMRIFHVLSGSRVRLD